MPQPLVNGTSYAWSQAEVLIAGQRVNGITAVSYEDMQEMQENYGAGNRPVSRGYGKIECKGSMTVEMAEVEALQASVSTGRIQDIPEFDVVISFLPEGGVVKSHILHNCRFKGNKRDIKTGDMTVEAELELMVSHISWT